MWSPARRWKECLSEVRVARGAAQLVRESESFLAGGYAWELLARQEPIPGWAWLSGLAHAPPAALAAWANDGSAAVVDGPTTRWWAAVSLLARTLLREAAQEGCPVQDLQRSVLVGLELEEVPVTTELLYPEDLVDEFRRSLAYHRNSS